MSAAETRALIERYYDAFNAGSIEGMLACLDEDVAHDVNQGERRIGLEKFKQFSIQRALSFKEKLADMVIMVSEDGRRAAAEFTVRGTYLKNDEGLPPADGQTYSLPAGAFFEIDDSKITRVTTHWNVKDLIAQISR